MCLWVLQPYLTVKLIWLRKVFLSYIITGKSKSKEGTFTLEQINEILNRVDPMFYQDIVEERSGNGYCGYLNCSNTPSNDKQQYRISITYNKVFEIDERKKYCSDVCFRRSMFLLGETFCDKVFINRFWTVNLLPLS